MSYKNLKELNGNLNLDYTQLKKNHEELKIEKMSRKVGVTKDKENLELLLDESTLELYKLKKKYNDLSEVSFYFGSFL